MKETSWDPQMSGVLTEDFAKSLRLIRQATHADTSEDVHILASAFWAIMPP